MSKFETAERILNKGLPLYIGLTPKSRDVIVPVEFADREHLTLLFGKNLPIAIPDMILSVIGICGSLSFGGREKFCFIPWTAVTALNEYGFGERPESADSHQIPGLNLDSYQIPGLRPTRPVLRLIKGGKK